MKNLLIVFTIFMSSGCNTLNKLYDHSYKIEEREQGHISLTDPKPNEPKSIESPYISKIYVIIGQSNAARMQDHGGEARFKEVMGEDVVTINCGIYGAYLDEWEIPKRSFKSCKAKVSVELAKNHKNYVAGILTYQGESDASDYSHDGIVQHTTDYKETFERLATSYRSEFGNQNIPLVYAQISTTTSNRYPYWDLIQNQQSSVSLLNSKMITTTDLTTSDGIHLNDASHYILGERYANAFKTLTSVN